MKKYKSLFTVLMLFVATFCWGQNKYEREFRIRKSQFPEKAHVMLNDYLENTRSIRYYKELDSARVSYEVKFKKERLFYSIEFDSDGNLEDVEVLIKKADIPNASYKAMETYFKANFSKYRIRRIQQQYTLDAFGTISKTLNNAFQNLIDPKINYELIVAGKTATGFQEFEILFDADGNFISRRKSLPANYDHVLY